MIRSKTTIILLFSSLGLNLSAITYAIYRGINRGDFARYYKEGYFLTNISTFHLLILSFLCFYIYSLNKRYLKTNTNHKKGKPILWLVLCLGFLFLGIDEQFMIHEYIDIFTHNLMESILNYQGNSITRRLDDIVVLFYFIFGVFMIAKYKAEMRLFKDAKSYLRIGLILTLVMISIDIITSQNDLFSILFPIENNIYMIKLFGAIEDSIKLFALTFFCAWLGKCISIVQNKTLTNLKKYNKKKFDKSGSKNKRRGINN
tara:strand:+ start:338 stop:1114 length:777 start_codon:yes stop_codon:yes gene_type:complete